MIDRRSKLFIRPEWLLQNPYLSQSCSMQTNDTMMFPTANGDGAGAQMPLSPPVFPEDSMEGFTDLCGLFQNNERAGINTTGTTVDKLAYGPVDNEPALHSDNAVDPDIFFCHANANQSRETLHSTASSWAPSPYGELDNMAEAGSPAFPESPFNPPVAPNPARTFAFNNSIERQISLNRAIEVLASCPTFDIQSTPSSGVNPGCYPPTPSPSVNEDDQYLQHPSPSFCPITSSIPPAHPRNRSFSEYGVIPSVEETTRARAVSAEGGHGTVVNVYDLMQPFNVPMTVLAEENENDSPPSNENNNENNTTSTTECTSAEVCSLSSQDSLYTTPALESLPSLIKRDIANLPAHQDDSMYMDGLLEDFMQATDPQQPSAPVEEIKIGCVETINADHAYSASQETAAAKESLFSALVDAEAPAQQASSSKLVIDLTEEEEEPSTSRTRKSSSKMVRTPSYIRKRSQNNVACRESRKKKKQQRDLAQDEVKRLMEDNELQKRKIKELKAEVEETRARLIARMTSGRSISGSGSKAH